MNEAGRMAPFRATCMREYLQDRLNSLDGMAKKLVELKEERRYQCPQEYWSMRVAEHLAEFRSKRAVDFDVLFARCQRQLKAHIFATNELSNSQVGFLSNELKESGFIYEGMKKLATTDVDVSNKRKGEFTEFKSEDDYVAKRRPLPPIEGMCNELFVRFFCIAVAWKDLHAEFEGAPLDFAIDSHMSLEKECLERAVFVIKCEAETGRISHKAANAAVDRLRTLSCVGNFDQLADSLKELAVALIPKISDELALGFLDHVCLEEDSAPPRQVLMSCHDTLCSTAVYKLKRGLFSTAQAEYLATRSEARLRVYEQILDGLHAPTVHLPTLRHRSSAPEECSLELSFDDDDDDLALLTVFEEISTPSIRIHTARARLVRPLEEFDLDANVSRKSDLKEDRHAGWILTTDGRPSRKQPDLLYHVDIYLR